MAAYSGLSGACCPRPGGLLGSYRGGPPSGTLAHWPDQFGYLPKSTICASAPVAHKAAVRATAPIDLAYCMKSSLRRLARSRGCGLRLAPKLPHGTIRGTGHLCGQPEGCRGKILSSPIATLEGFVR